MERKVDTGTEVDGNAIFLLSRDKSWEDFSKFSRSLKFRQPKNISPLPGIEPGSPA